MSLATDLLEQAGHLAKRERAGAPKQASLRRAVSSAYYALFHLLAGDAANLAAPLSPIGLRAQIQRALAHEDMKFTCKSILSARPTPVFLHLMGRPSVNLIRVATAFVDLQEARHRADYDVTGRYSRTDVQLLIQQCQSAFAAWDKVRGSEASVFLAALLSQKRWKS